MLRGDRGTVTTTMGRKGGWKPLTPQTARSAYSRAIVEAARPPTIMLMIFIASSVRFGGVGSDGELVGEGLGG